MSRSLLYAFDESLEVAYLHLYTESPVVVDELEIIYGVQSNGFLLCMFVFVSSRVPRRLLYFQLRCGEHGLGSGTSTVLDILLSL